MDSNKINALLEKYFDGASNLEEERILKQYFQQDNIAEDLLPYKGLFQYFEVEQEATLSADFESRLMEKIQAPPVHKGIRTMQFSWMRVAAAILFLVALVFVVRQWQPGVDKNVNWSAYEADNPEEAYEATMAALALVSKKMNTGEKETLKGLGKIKQVNKEVHN